ncbi:MAG TPA: DUF6798 domain-containing protein, partial [Hyphomicrobiaceae bacterium]|nr:DUF6798 domain-containing protein [Hyphomicrobiaceae bacterium]
FLLIFSLCFVALNSNNGTGRLLEGFAHQYVSSYVFEPASFGVLAVLALLLFRLREPGWAAVLIVCAAWVHPVYAIPGLLLLCGMGIARWRFGTDVAPLPVAIWLGGMVGCCGSAAFTYSQLFPIDPASQAEALRVITTIRIPHHALPEVWIDFDAVVKLVALAAAIAMTWRDPLGVVLLTATIGAVAFTLWVYLTRDLSLALAGPWRVSAIIVPAAIAVLMGRGLELAYAWCQGNAQRRRLGVAAMCVGAIASMGAASYTLVQDRLRPPPAYYAWVRTHAAPKQLYLTPVEDEKFRLLTGQPQYASWKSHPHRARAVLEWYRRVGVAQHLTIAPTVTCEDLGAVAREGVTHLVRSQTQPWPGCPGWRATYRDGRSAIWERVSLTAAEPTAMRNSSPSF